MKMNDAIICVVIALWTAHAAITAKTQTVHTEKRMAVAGLLLMRM